MNQETKLAALKMEALHMMELVGYPLVGEIDIELNKDLEFMGYTTEVQGKPVIVVSGKALDSGVLNLLIHEMSHIYRSQSGHPSHDYALLTSIAAWVMHGKAVHPYQEEILKNILNIIQDLYADDISFKVFDHLDKQVNLSQFFLNWIHEPLKATSQENLWQNAEYLLDTAFAQSNLIRHNISDNGGEIEKAVKKFLSLSEKRVATKYDYFRDFMINLPEDPNAKGFEALLIRYLSEFLKLTKPV